MTAPMTREELSFQKRVVNWLMECFSMEVCRDGTERNHRFLEEALELVQALGCTRSEAHQLVDYVFGRPLGEPLQELGGVMVTLTALANCHDMNLMAAAETELARVWTKIDKIRAKQLAKPKHSPLPEHVPGVAQSPPPDARADAELAARIDAAHFIRLVGMDKDVDGEERDRIVAALRRKPQETRGDEDLTRADDALVSARERFRKIILGTDARARNADTFANGEAIKGFEAIEAARAALSPPQQETSMYRVAEHEECLNCHCSPGEFCQGTRLQETPSSPEPATIGDIPSESCPPASAAMGRFSGSGDPSAPAVLPDCGAGEAVAFINARLADLAEANAFYGKDHRLGAPDKIARNDREISWLKDLRSMIAAPQPSQRLEREGIADALDDSQSLLVMLLHLAETNDGSIPGLDWANEDLSKLVTDQITENRTALSPVPSTSRCAHGNEPATCTVCHMWTQVSSKHPRAPRYPDAISPEPPENAQ